MVLAKTALILFPGLASSPQLGTLCRPSSQQPRAGATLTAATWWWSALAWLTFKSQNKNAPLQFFILILHLEPGRNTVASVKKCSSLALLCQVVDEQANLSGQESGEKVDEKHCEQGGWILTKLVARRMTRLAAICFHWSISFTKKAK